MYKSKKHTIFFNSVTLLLVIAFLIPSLVKFNHIFEDHKHESCETPQTNHYHEVDLDCEFYKFNKTNQFHLSNLQDYELYVAEGKLATISFYKHLISHRQLSFSLRAPPKILV